MNPTESAAIVQRSLTRIRRCRSMNPSILAGILDRHLDHAEILLWHVERAARQDAARAGMDLTRIMPEQSDAVKGGGPMA